MGHRHVLADVVSALSHSCAFVHDCSISQARMWDNARLNAFDLSSQQQHRIAHPSIRVLVSQVLGDVSSVLRRRSIPGEQHAHLLYISHALHTFLGCEQISGPLCPLCSVSAGRTDCILHCGCSTVTRCTLSTMTTAITRRATTDCCGAFWGAQIESTASGSKGRAPPGICGSTMHLLSSNR